MPTAIFFNGARINVPGAYSKIDASALASLGISPVGIVALLGTAEGGKPLTVDSEDADSTRPERANERYRSGDLRLASAFCFEPSLDDAVPGGAQRIVGVKVNDATQSTETFLDGAGNDAMVVSSRDYGLFTSQISVMIEAGTNVAGSKKITVVFEDTTETFDDVGGTPILDLEYTPGAGGYAAATALLSLTGLVGTGTRSDVGLDSQRTADIPAPGVLNYVSSNAGDTTQSITTYGLTAGNVAASETVALNGVVPVQGAVVFISVLAIRKSAPTLGTVTVSDFPVTTTLFTATNVQATRGLYVCTNSPIVPAGSTWQVDVGVAGANGMLVTQNATGAEVLQRFDFSAAGAIALTGAGKKLLYVVSGDIAAARTTALSAQMFSLASAAYKTVQKVVDALNALDGIAANADVSNPTTFLMTDADFSLTPTNFLSVVGDFFANLFAVIDTLNTGSGLVTAERSTPSPDGIIVPANTVAPVFLVGGTEGTTSIGNWQTAFTLLKKRRVNIIVPLTRDPAVHALLASHLVYRAGKGRSEANGYIGIGKVDGSGETKSAIKTQIRALATRHISAISQEMQRNDPDSGEATYYPPYIFAAEAAGMQAGSTVGEPLTRKRPLALAIRNDPSWTVDDDKEELIDAGLMLFEVDDVDGVRCIRSITTHLADDNVVFSEMSANAAANTAVYELRRRLDKKVGNRGLAGSAAAIKGLANAILGELIDDEIIVAYQALQVEQIGDVFPVSVQIAPVLPINFIPITVHLVAVRLAA